MTGRLVTALALLATLTAPAGAQQEQGDFEVQFAGSLQAVVGQQDVSVSTGHFQSKFGYFVTDRLELGAFPSLVYSRTEVRQGGSRTTTSDTKLGTGVFVTYSFLAEDARTVPYLGSQFYRIDLTDENERGWVGVNGGARYYFTRRTAFDLGANYLLGLGERGGALVLIQVGLGFLF